MILCVGGAYAMCGANTADSMEEFWPGQMLHCEPIGFSWRFGTPSINQWTGLLKGVMSTSPANNIVFTGQSFGIMVMRQLTYILSTYLGDVHVLFALDDRMSLPFNRPWNYIDSGSVVGTRMLGVARRPPSLVHPSKMPPMHWNLASQP